MKEEIKAKIEMEMQEMFDRKFEVLKKDLREKE